MWNKGSFYNKQQQTLYRHKVRVQLGPFVQLLIECLYSCTCSCLWWKHCTLPLCLMRNFARLVHVVLTFISTWTFSSNVPMLCSGLFLCPFASHRKLLQISETQKETEEGREGETTNANLPLHMHLCHCMQSTPQLLLMRAFHWQW